MSDEELVVAEIVAPESATESPAPAASPERPFTLPAETPTQSGPLGLRYDFNDGCRLLLPEGPKPWRARLWDIDTGNILFDVVMKEGRVNSSKRYFVRFRIEVWSGEELVFSHDYDARDRAVLIQLPVGTLGDSLGWFPYALRFQEVHGARVTCVVAERMIALLGPANPGIELVAPADVEAEGYYATYNIGLFFDDAARIFQPCDFRHVGLHRTAGHILGVDPTEIAPLMVSEDGGRPIEEPYVCIAVQSSSQAKFWNNPSGWREIVAFLKEAGYRVICIDQKPLHGDGLVWNHIPWGAEDQTGDRPLTERARWLKHAEFFVGLSSGLSWLAWAAEIPVVMISGFTHPSNEFATPYRVINYHACNSCWNDPRVRFDHKDFLWCPHHKGTPQHFECTRLITPEQVKRVIRTIPGFGQEGEAAEATAERSLIPAQ